MNRLLINMKNKIDIINGAIGQCYKLMNDETIVLNGLQRFEVTRGDKDNAWFKQRIYDLTIEKNDLYERIQRMGG